MMTSSFVLASIQPRRTRRHGDATLCVPLPSITANSKYRSNGGAVFIGRHSISGRHSKINLVYPNSDLSTGFPWVNLGGTAVHEAEAAHRATDLETIIQDLLDGQYSKPVRVVSQLQHR
jgi:hypothetical protein